MDERSGGQAEVDEEVAIIFSGGDRMEKGVRCVIGQRLHPRSKSGYSDLTRRGDHRARGCSVLGLPVQVARTGAPKSFERRSAVAADSLVLPVSAVRPHYRQLPLSLELFMC